MSDYHGDTGELAAHLRDAGELLEEPAMTDTTHDAPLSADRLAEIRQTAQEVGWLYAESSNEAYGLYSELQELLAEVDRLREREAALLAVVRAVAEASVSLVDDPGVLFMFTNPAALREQARAALASAAADASEEA